jgi:hypothetical protein
MPIKVDEAETLQLKMMPNSAVTEVEEDTMSQQEIKLDARQSEKKPKMKNRPSAKQLSQIRQKKVQIIKSASVESIKVKETGPLSKYMFKKP